jgi:hypothetical protein
MQQSCTSSAQDTQQQRGHMVYLRAVSTLPSTAPSLCPMPLSSLCMHSTWPALKQEQCCSHAASSHRHPLSLSPGHTPVAHTSSTGRVLTGPHSSTLKACQQEPLCPEQHNRTPHTGDQPRGHPAQTTTCQQPAASALPPLHTPKPLCRPPPRCNTYMVCPPQHL